MDVSKSSPRPSLKAKSAHVGKLSIIGGTWWGRIILYTIIGTMACVLILSIMTREVTIWPTTRSASDPVVLSNLVGLIPLAIAMYFKMPLTAAFIASAVLASLVYHVFQEDTAHSGLGTLDSITANALFVYGIGLYALSLTMCPNIHLSISSVLFMIMAVVCYKQAHRKENDEHEEIYYDRMHTVWHILAFLTITVTILNVYRGNCSDCYSKTPWLRKLQRFTY